MAVSTNPKIAILATGSELLDGRVSDTNSTYIAARLTDAGISLLRTVVCGDTEAEISRCLRFLAAEHDVILVSGGLGPTSDDLTREAISNFAERPLELNESVLSALKQRYLARGRDFDPSNEKQALFPRGAEIIANPNGTACGFHLHWSGNEGERGVDIYVAPGVPRELRPMFDDFILPDLTSRYRVNILRTSGFRTFGVPESTVGRVTSACALPPAVTVSYRAAFPEVHILLKTHDQSIDLEMFRARVISAIGLDFVISQDVGIGLLEHVPVLLNARNATVSVAESCTGGLLGSLLTTLPGASSYFLGGMLVYSNSLKTKLLGVDAALIQAHGAVSAAVAEAMAMQIRLHTQSTIGISITGIAGPDGGSLDKPVGTFVVGLSTETGTKSHNFHYNAERDLVRRYAAYAALNCLRQYLLTTNEQKNSSN